MQLEEICFLAIDICGIFNEAKDNITYNLMFDWFIAGHSEIFVNFLFDKCGEISHSSICSEYQIIFMNSILKMWKSIVLCIPPKRVIFHSSSRNGLLLFKMATNVTNSYLSYILTIINNKQSNESPNEEANEPNDVNINYPQNESIHDIDSNGLNHHHYKGIKYSFVILQNLVSGGYVPFGAFKIYNDLVFENTLKILTDTFKALHIETIIQYPSVLSSVIHLFRDLVFYHFEILFSIDFNLIDTILLYTEKCLLQPHEEIQNMAIDIVANILQNSIDRLHGQNPIQDYFSDFSTIFFILWQIILHDTSKINSNIVFSIKTMIFLKISSIELVKEKIYEKIFEQKRVLLNKLFDELSVKLNSKNSHDIILQLQSILTFLQQFTSFSFV
ncbi:hypothetical protein TRFO_21323 [Tritrichomonas foetus]|uniref:Uncharacterized protein n=1 Tax=Tritrichomonas foetus TaxID=1144522 RepID=A0A1J4KIQ7_9EUKA|nr:hypothetical protein TRFO_21323 [Tritrichomonas foetus]|eukprot:OHT09700.1 hypothetical protein TRFO_21323 [Tritrichomonas foetus]